MSGDIAAGSGVASFRAYSLYVDHDAKNYRDASFDEVITRERIRSYRAGGAAQYDVSLTESLRLTAVTHLLVEGGKSTIEAGGGLQTTNGSIPILEPAVGAVWKMAPWLTLDTAGGLAIPFGKSNAEPWPEVKLTATFLPAPDLELKLVGARKGRLPSLRDRFSPTQGNPSIGPETSTSVEGNLRYEPRDWAKVEVSGFWRSTNGLIRIPPGGPRGPSGIAPLENVGDLTVRGLEARAELSPLSWLGTGIAYAFATATSEVLGEDPLDFFAKHRGEIWASARYERDAGLWTRARYTGVRLDNGSELAPYTTLDGALWVRLSALQVTLRIENALGARYELRDGIPGFGPTFLVGLDGTLR